MPALADQLFLTANEYLEGCCAALNAMTLQGAPARQFVSPGVVYMDCEQIGVQVETVSIASTAPSRDALDTGRRGKLSGTVNMVRLVASVYRCVPSFGDDGRSAPAASAYDDAAMVVLSDLWAIWNYVKRKHRENELFSKPTGVREMEQEPPVSVPPQGGFGGWQIPVTVQLDGVPLP